MNKEEQSKLRSSIKYDDYKVVINLLKDFPVDIHIVDGTPLNYAVLYEKYDLSKYLIIKGANVNALYEVDYTPLMSAIDRKNIELIKLLLENGADVNLKDKYGNDALFKAVNTLNLDLIKLIVDTGASPFIGDNPENYSAYDSARDIGATEVVAYFDSLKHYYKRH